MASWELRSDGAAVTPVVRQAAAWAWRLLVIVIAIATLLEILRRLGVVVVPVALALLVTALLLPAVDLLDRIGAPRGVAVALVMVAGLAVLSGILAFVITQFIDGVPGLVEQVTHSIDSTRDWLIKGPAHLSRDQVNHIGDTAIQSLRNHQEQLTTGALSTAGTLSEIVTGALLGLFTVIFFLLDGRNIWRFSTLIVPLGVRERIRKAGNAGFHSLIGYIRATSLVAFVDAAGIGTALAIMGVPLALPLASVVFLGAFVPLIGALVSGFLAIVVALLAKGLLYALITLGVIVAVMQIEAHVLQPLVMGRAVSIHPLAIVLGIAAGGVLAGVVGALIAVPTIAFLNSAVRVLMSERTPPRDSAVDDDVDTRPVHRKAGE
ncbi:AI-2E family transporter [Mycobacterium sp. 155]|uniref:AI-2E family transporter n=1 Tax=Mycobacterium sp. 155 TaxID=1157943 RepID=UPI00036DA37E|nr:AI-2E family transporter [Mycobacterium sp. 155]